MASKLSRMTTDHEEIRRWAEERGAQPSEVARTERNGETGMIRLDFPGYSGAGSLKPISWEEWFQKFDDSGLALVYQERTAGGQRSNFNKLIGRETAEARAHGANQASRRSLRGRGGGARRTASSRSRRGQSRRGASARSATRTRRSGAGRGQGARKASARRTGARRQAPSRIAARLTGRARMPMGEGASRSGSRRSTSGRGRGGSRSSTARKVSRRTAGRSSTRSGSRGRRR